MNISPREAKKYGIVDKGKKANPYAPYKSAWERDYAEHLRADWVHRGGTVLYEAASFVLVPASEHQRGVRYVPDFIVVYPDRQVEIHEVKGHWRPGAKHKVKALAALIKPVPVYVVRKGKGGNWERERF